MLIIKTNGSQIPSLYTALTAPQHVVENHLIYGVNANTYVLLKNAIVELVVVNIDGGVHPFHLHSHNFQVIARSGAAPNDTVLDVPSSIITPPIIMRRDTLLINAGGYAIIRFKTDNPGITLFYCHIEWHVEAGLLATFVEAPKELEAQGFRIPPSHAEACWKQGVLTKGNAVGNSRNWLDLTGANTVTELNNYGALINAPH